MNKLCLEFVSDCPECKKSNFIVVYPVSDEAEILTECIHCKNKFGIEYCLKMMAHVFIDDGKIVDECQLSGSIEFIEDWDDEGDEDEDEERNES